MKKIRQFKINEYVLATKYKDKYPLDPWSIGKIYLHGEDRKGKFCCVEYHGFFDKYRYRHAWKLASVEEGVAYMHNMTLWAQRQHQQFLIGIHEM